MAYGLKMKSTITEQEFITQTAAFFTKKEAEKEFAERKEFAENNPNLSAAIPIAIVEVVIEEKENGNHNSQS